ncbi:uncharacterized protein AMSG_02673 [Thecamonas trahens ATCC 50062]|uniref:Uncharacterized protein n=1 Tax=Thecamonas trahens ATCC 50062 TaxID=461836 RepID=A0A0L0D1S8_THETB|nr:hypothetical protein AMSG_02673 [Thecamonas trahens ATCC 50062]KNC46222.1 hypothetical protein AMSG_02673 [Thecamonas trahens ATCC 50062]|eukprot:XP_013760519.1 hypothetical protein AMSG_02673 [Thecamonas trahens ATCC 50062]
MVRGRLKLHKKTKPFKLRVAKSASTMECSQAQLALMACVGSVERKMKTHGPTINYHLKRLERQQQS